MKGMGTVTLPGWLLAAAAALQAYWLVSGVTWYEVSTASRAVWDLLHIGREDVDKCVRAYQYFQNGTRGSETEIETEHVRAYYTIVNHVLALASIEKMYIPGWVLPKESLYMNQLEWERRLFATLRVSGPESRLLDIGCGRGRIAHHLATLSGGKVSGFNIDAYQVGNAREYAAAEGMSGRLDFKQGDHHKRFQYEDASFSGAYSVQAIWPFFKVHELDSVARELFRVLKPGAHYSCSEYLLTPHFDWNNAEHVELHRLFLPTLAATQSNYPADVTDALQRAGFRLITSMPSARPSWPLTDQKTDLYILMRSVVQVLTAIGLSPAWLDTLMTQLLLGGQAWAEAEKMKIADLNWEIVVEKPLS